MAMLNYEAEIRPTEGFADKLTKLTGQTRQIRLAESLIAELEDKEFDYSKYVDRTRQKVEQVIESNRKRKGAIEAPEDEPQERHVLSLMDALEKSLKSGKKSGKAAPKKRGVKTKSNSSRRSRAS